MGERVLSVAMAQTTPMPMDVTFTCAPGEVLGIYGPSGSGKTTILRTIAGLHRPARGRVSVGAETWLDSRAGLSRPPHRRRVGYVFQEYALFPHMTALENIRAARGDRRAHERRAAALELLDAVQLAGKGGQRPAELSGGERQRVAVARALARQPDVLLLDEPFSAVDRAVRRQLQDLVDTLRRSFDIPLVLVTHDFEDIVRLASHLLILDRGHATAAGTVRDVTSRADVAWLGDTVGAGAVFEAVVTHVDTDRGLAELTFDGGRLFATDTALERGRRVRVRIPAREVILATEAPIGLSLHNVLQVTVEAVTHDDRQHRAIVRLAVGRECLLAEVTTDAVGRMGIRVGRPLCALVKSVSLQVLPLVQTMCDPDRTR